MNDFDENEKHIISKLNDLPDIEDRRTKEEVWQKLISHQNRQEKHSSKRSPHLVPIFSSILVVAILAIIIPYFINHDSMKTSDEHSSNNGTEHDIGERSVTENDGGNADDNSNDVTTTHTTQEEFDQKILMETGSDDQIVYGVLPDLQGQYMVPISFTVPDSDDLDDYYNKLDDYMDPNTWGTGEYALKDDVTMNINKSDRQVIINTGSEFSIGGDSSNEAIMFLETLTYMFEPLGINEALFETEDDSGVDLGPIGVMQNLDIEPMPSVPYKIYQEAPDKESFLIPVPSIQGDEMSIQEAIEALKHEQDDLHIQKTVPNDVDIDVSDEDTELIITFTDDSSLDNDQASMTMIESILMTAKSFDYTTVLFKGADIEEIGPYDLSRPIDVPLAANPIDIADGR